MKTTILATAAAAALAGLLSITPASAQSFSLSLGNQTVSDYCDRHWRDRDCREFRRGHRDWNESHYRRFFGRHGLSFNFDINVGTRSRGWSSHVARCEARYRSYDHRSDTFLGFDGDRHRCTL